MDWILRRRPTETDWMFGELTTGGVRCYTLEDELRQVKVHGETAIPAGRFRLRFVDSARFGPRTIALDDVPGFTEIRIHGGNTDEQTLGCPIVGNRINEETGEIFGAQVAGVLDRLKDELEKHLVEAGDAGVWLTILNAPGDRYVDSRELAGGDLA